MPVLTLEPVRPPGRTVADLLDAYLSHLAGKSLIDARSALNKWARPAVGHVRLDQLNPRHLELLHAGIPFKRQANHVVDYLHAALHRAERWGWITRGTNPAAYRGEYKHRERPRKTILHTDQRRAMWRYLDAEEASGVPHRVIRSQALALLALTGLRKGEIIGLPWDEVNLRARIPTAYIENTKTGEPKHCYLSPQAVDLLLRVNTEGNVFPWRSVRPLDLAWQELRATCGLDGVVLHDLRRTFWSLIGSAGVSVEDAAATSGHADLKVHCRHYRHVSDDRKLEIAALGGSLMARKGEVG